MLTSEFAEQLKKLDPRLEIVPNPNRKGLSNVKLDGEDICPVPSEIIKEETDPGYVYAFPNGWVAPHNSTKEVLAKVHRILELLKTRDGYELFYGKE